MAVLIDTSTWIEFLRKPGTSAGRRLAGLLESGQARLCGPVESELVSGARNAPQLREFLSAVPYVTVERPDFIRSGELQRDLLAKGDLFKPMDALIAAIALRRSLPLLTLDLDFKRVPGLKLDPF